MHLILILRKKPDTVSIIRYPACALRVNSEHVFLMKISVNTEGRAKTDPQHRLQSTYHAIWWRGILVPLIPLKWKAHDAFFYKLQRQREPT